MNGASLGYHVINHGMADFENEFADEYYVQLGFNWYNGTNIQARYGAQ